ncbi:hypothetical protein Avbf_05329 [Armadillidium vulgare]|nr:hypothetical protein Avbf_05329 [Armadillidium vulgare]
MLLPETSTECVKLLINIQLLSINILNLVIQELLMMKHKHEFEPDKVHTLQKRNTHSHTECEATSFQQIYDEELLSFILLIYNIIRFLISTVLID